MTAPGIARRLGALVARGRLVVVDPRRTETAAIASEHVFIRPGSDAWFLVALLQPLLAPGPPRTEAYAGKLRGLDEALRALQAIDTADVEARTGVPRARIAAIAADFRAAPSAVAYGRMGVSTQAHGTLCQWLIQLVNLVTGNLDRVGGAGRAQRQCRAQRPAGDGDRGLSAAPATGRRGAASARRRWRCRTRVRWRRARAPGSRRAPSRPGSRCG